MVAPLDIAGQRFGRLTVINRVSSDHNGRVHWACRCDCGVETKVRGSALTAGNTGSCGCLVREKMAETGAKNGTHHLSRTGEYHSWRAMKLRCYDEKNNRYKYYGARGIKVCDRWRDSFENFLQDMGKKPSEDHSIDRYPDMNGDYSPANCRWATRSEQSSNRRPYRCHTTKLTPEQVLAIRIDTRPKVIIGKEYGVSGQQVLSVQRRKSWKNIEG